MAPRKRSYRIDGQRVRELREGLRLRQIDLAAACDVTRHWIMAIENDTPVGDGPPRVGGLVLRTLASTLGVAPESLVLEEGSRTEVA